LPTPSGRGATNEKFRGLTGYPEVLREERQFFLQKPKQPQPKIKKSKVMKNINVKKHLLAGLALAGLALAPTSQAQSLTVVTVSGGNGSSSWAWNQVTNFFGGAGTVVTVGSTSSSTVRSFQGHLASLPGAGLNVELDFILNGAVGGLQDITYGNVETNALNLATNTPTLVISSTTPDAVGLSASIFTEAKTFITPYEFIKNPLYAPALLTVSNLTQRQAAYLEGAAGPNFHSAYVGGSATNDSVYFVGRNTASAVRTETDANIYFTGSLATYTTNASGQPILDPAGGQTSGSNIRILLSLIPNAIGTVALQDVKTNIGLSYEGVPYSSSNLEYGNYPLWGYEHYYWLSTGSGAPSPAQLTVITNLLYAVTNTTSQFSSSYSSVFTNSFESYSSLRVQRSVDGGPITWK
jgi:hypothetical protein